MRRRGQRGIALVAVLWALVLLAVIAATVLSESRTQSRLARNFLDAAQAEALADGGVYRAMEGLARPVASGGWRVDGTVYAWARPEGEVRIRIEDEGGKIDLNRANGRLLRNLFLAAGLEPQRAEALAAAVQDFRDADDTRRPDGAEDSDYAGAGLPHGAKDAPLDAVEELAQVYGMTREIYGAVAGAITVHARTRRPDAKVAPPLVIAALRGGGGTAAGGISPQPPTAALAPGADAPGVIDPSVAILYLGPTGHRSRSRTFTIHAEARTLAGGYFTRRAVVRMAVRGDPPFRILAWGRGGPALFPAATP
ncbi:MAG: general secretion pathway protein GspK [Alphaproteobacteria bacterium]